MSGKLKAAVTIQFAETKLAITNGHVGGWTTSQVIDNCLNRCELTLTIQGRLAHSPAACPMAIGAARPRRFQSTAPPSWTKMHSHTQVSLCTQRLLDFLIFSLKSILSSSMLVDVWAWLCRPAGSSDHLCGRPLCKRVSLFVKFTHGVSPTFVAKFIAQSIYRKSSSTLPKMPNSNEGLKIKGQGSRRKDPIIPFFPCYWGGHETFNVFETNIICFTNNDTSFMNPSSPRHSSANQQQRWSSQREARLRLFHRNAQWRSQPFPSSPEVGEH